MDFMSLLIVIVGLGAAAVIALVLIYAVSLGLTRAWRKFAHRHPEHHAH